MADDLDMCRDLAAAAIMFVVKGGLYKIRINGKWYSRETLVSEAESLGIKLPKREASNTPITFRAARGEKND